MNDTDVLFLCLDLVLCVLLHNAYIAPVCKSRYVARALCLFAVYVTVTMGLLALARLLGGCAWWSISSSYVIGWMIVQTRLVKMIKAPVSEGCSFDVKQTRSDTEGRS